MFDLYGMYKKYSKTACLEGDEKYDYLAKDRGRRIVCAPSAIEKVVELFIKTKVVPEIDSYRFSIITGLAKTQELPEDVAYEVLQKRGVKDIVTFRGGNRIRENVDLIENDWGGYLYSGTRYKYLMFDKNLIKTYTCFTLEDMQKQDEFYRRTYNFTVFYSFKPFDKNIGEFIYKEAE